jgi:His/Glu/Gln/Arg/opine family amino acid ABC transporter permease subunit
MDFSFLPKYWKFFVSGAEFTILLSVFTVLIGTVLGVFLSLLRLSRYKLLSWPTTAYIEFIRGTPMLVQLYIIYYGLPNLGVHFPEVPAFGSDFPDLTAAILTLSLNSAAYMAETFRAGIQAVDKGQTEAARSLGMSSGMTLRLIVLPQAFRNILPALGNELVTIIKDSSIVSVIGIHELMYNADTVRSNIYKAFEPMIAAAVLYFIMTFAISTLLGRLERRLKSE